MFFGDRAVTRGTVFVGLVYLAVLPFCSTVSIDSSEDDGIRDFFSAIWNSQPSVYNLPKKISSITTSMHETSDQSAGGNVQSSGVKMCECNDWRNLIEMLTAAMLPDNMYFVVSYLGNGYENNLPESRNVLSSLFKDFKLEYLDRNNSMHAVMGANFPVLKEVIKKYGSLDGYVERLYSLSMTKIFSDLVYTMISPDYIKNYLPMIFGFDKESTQSQFSSINKIFNMFQEPGCEVPSNQNLPDSQEVPVKQTPDTQEIPQIIEDIPSYLPGVKPVDSSSVSTPNQMMETELENSSPQAPESPESPESSESLDIDDKITFPDDEVLKYTEPKISVEEVPHLNMAQETIPKTSETIQEVQHVSKDNVPSPDTDKKPPENIELLKTLNEKPYESQETPQDTSQTVKQDSDVTNMNSGPENEKLSDNPIVSEAPKSAPNSDEVSTASEEINNKSVSKSDEYEETTKSPTTTTESLLQKVSEDIMAVPKQILNIFAGTATKKQEESTTGYPSTVTPQTVVQKEATVESQPANIPSIEKVPYPYKQEKPLVLPSGSQSSIQPKTEPSMVLPPEVEPNQPLQLQFTKNNVPIVTTRNSDKTSGLTLPSITDLLRAPDTNKPLANIGTQLATQVLQPLSAILGKNYVPDILGHSVTTDRYPTNIALLRALLKKAKTIQPIKSDTRLLGLIRKYIAIIEYVSPTVVLPALVSSTNNLTAVVLYATFNPTKLKQLTIEEMAVSSSTGNDTVTIPLVNPRTWLQSVNLTDPYKDLIPSFPSGSKFELTLRPFRQILRTDKIIEILGNEFSPFVYPNRGALLVAILQKLRKTAYVRSDRSLKITVDLYLKAIELPPTNIHVPETVITNTIARPAGKWQPNLDSLLIALPEATNNQEYNMIQRIKAFLLQPTLLERLGLTNPSPAWSRGEFLHKIIIISLTRHLVFDQETSMALEYYKDKIDFDNAGAMPLVWTWIPLNTVTSQVSFDSQSANYYYYIITDYE